MEAALGGTASQALGAGAAVASEGQTQPISADEIALYDRQIRLWGLKAQERIRTANILIINAKAVANEIAKNLVLAGVQSLTLLDSQNVTEEDLGAQFLINDELIGKNRAEAAVPSLQKLNSRVAVQALNQDAGTLLPDFFSPYTLVIATDLPFPLFSTINASTRLAKKPLYAAGAHGLFGFIFADLIEHKYVIERVQSNKTTQVGTKESATRTVIGTSVRKEGKNTIELVEKSEKYYPWILANSSPLSEEILLSRHKPKKVTPLLSCLRALWDFEQLVGHRPNGTTELARFTQLVMSKQKELQLPPNTMKAEFLRAFMQNLGSELAPVTAFLGGLLAQDVINVLGGREQPIQNLVLFDGEDDKGQMYSLVPELTEESLTTNGHADFGMTANSGLVYGLDGTVPLYASDASMMDMNGMGMDPGAIASATDHFPPLGMVPVPVGNGTNGLDMPPHPVMTADIMAYASVPAAVTQPAILDKTYAVGTAGIADQSAAPTAEGQPGASLLPTEQQAGQDDFPPPAAT